MKSFRNPKYLERYEDVVFDLEQLLETEPANMLTKKELVLDLLPITEEKLTRLIGITRARGTEPHTHRFSFGCHVNDRTYVRTRLQIVRVG